MLQVLVYLILRPLLLVVILHTIVRIIRYFFASSALYSCPARRRSIGVDVGHPGLDLSSMSYRP